MIWYDCILHKCLVLILVPEIVIFLVDVTWYTNIMNFKEQIPFDIILYTMVNRALTDHPSGGSPLLTQDHHLWFKVNYDKWPGGLFALTL